MTVNSTSGTNSSSSAYTTATSSKRLSGIISGLDTDSIVQQLTMGTQSKIDKQMQNKQVAQWQQDSYREVIKALSEFEDKYFSSTTSDSSILSSSFFNSTSIKNTSTLLNLSGSASAAKNMVVTGIAQLAKQAKLSSSHQVSNGEITTGTIQDEWTQSTISGGSVTINYGGKDYNVYLDDGFSFNQGDDISKLTDQLNTQISKIDGLKGNVKFNYDAGSGKVTLEKTGTATGGIGITGGTGALLSGLGLAVTSDNKATSILGTKAANSDYFFNHTIAAGSSLEFTIDGNPYKLSVSADIPVGSTPEQAAEILQSALKNQIGSNADLKNKLDVSVGSDGAVQFSLKDGVSGPLNVTGGSQNLLQGFGLSYDAGTKTYSTSGMLDQDKLMQSNLQDSLSGSTLTFNLNGLTKNINFLESEKDQYSTVDGLETYLRTKLDAAFGTGKVTVSADANGSLSFGVPSSDSTSVLTLTGSSKSGVLGMNGALKVYAGESNRINTAKSLEDLSPNLTTTLSTTPDGNYTINVNGKDFTFKSTDSLDTVINTINNDADANVTLTYSNTTNTFTATAKSGGSTSKVEITDKTGNLAEALFGGNVDASTAGYSGGQDAIMSVSFDGNPDDAVTITRSDNNFTLDGVSFELLGTNTPRNADGSPATNDDGTYKSADSPITFSVENETDDLYKKISDFVTDYNNIISLAYGKYTESNKTDGETYAPLTDAQKKEMSESQITSWETNAKKGLLQNDSLLYNLTLNMRSAMNDQVSSMKSALYEIGITTKSDDYSTTNGQLTIDEDKLKDALTNDPDKVAALFTSSDGIATKLKDVIDSNISTSTADPGILVQKAGTDSSTVDNSLLAKNIQDDNDQITSLKSLLEDQQNYYYNKFTQLEQYMSQMNSQASFFTANSSDS